MNHLSLFEEFKSLTLEDEPIDLVGFPSGSIIEVSKEEFDEMINLEDEGKLPFEIQWDGFGQWIYMDDEEEEIENWLEERRDPLGYNTKKYNL